MANIGDVSANEILAKSILIRRKKIDSWFISQYGINLYRGCAHNCVYCDGRSEKYQVGGEFGKDVFVKANAVEVLNKELSSRRRSQRRKIPPKSGYIMIGGGVSDSYQPLEGKYKLTRRALQVMERYSLPVHILTKSTLVKRDIDILKKINEKKKAIISFSFSSTQEDISRIFEPGVPSPAERLKTISYLKEIGFACGMFLLPVIPYITDKNEIIDRSIKDAKEAGVDFIIFGGMTLKEGRQKAHFYEVLKKECPDLVERYDSIYKGDKWGAAEGDYYGPIDKNFSYLTKKNKIPKRIPPILYKDVLNKNDLVVVILEHIYYLLKLKGKKSPFGLAAYSVSKLKKPISEYEDLTSIKGVESKTEKIISEILRNGTCRFYEELLYDWRY